MTLLMEWLYYPTTCDGPIRNNNVYKNEVYEHSQTWLIRLRFIYLLCPLFWSLPMPFIREWGQWSIKFLLIRYIFSIFTNFYFNVIKKTLFTPHKLGWVTSFPVAEKHSLRNSFCLLIGTPSFPATYKHSLAKNW